MKIPVGVSNRHVHLTKETYELLFGNANIEKKVDLNQPGEFASTSTLTIKTEAGVINNVRVLGPFRTYDQVEISRTDSYTLKLNPPVRKSGELTNAEPITLVGPNGEVNLQSNVIIANRHLHIDPKMAKELNVEDNTFYTLTINGEKKGTMEVVAKYQDPGFFEVHLDTDDANAFLLKNGDEIEINID